MSEHSKLPWKTKACKLHSGYPDILDAGGGFVTCVRSDKANAEFIVQACNSYDEACKQRDDLLAACKAFKRAAYRNEPLRGPIFSEALDMATAAIAVAEKTDHE